jgi:hypothetical protein
MLKKSLLILTALASLTMANAKAGAYPDAVIRAAHRHGFTDKQIAFCAAAHMVWDSSDNSFVDGALNGKQRANFAAIASGKAHPSRWMYLTPDYNWFGYLDEDGVLHRFQADDARYDRATNDYQVLIRGRWLTVGTDISRLTDF